MTDSLDESIAREQRRHTRRPLLWLACALLPGICLSCAANRPAKGALPAKNSIRSDQLLIVSDIKLSKDHPLIEDLKLRRRQASEKLELPLGPTPGMVYPF